MAWPLWTPRGSYSKRRPCRSLNEKLVKWPIQMALVKSLLVSRKMATAVFLSLALSVNCTVHVALLKELRTAVLDYNILIVVKIVFLSHLGQIIKLITVINSLRSFMNHDLNGKCESIQSMIVVASSS